MSKQPRNDNERLIVPIRISRTLRTALKELGKKDDTYETIIWRLIKQVKR